MKEQRFKKFVFLLICISLLFNQLAFASLEAETHSLCGSNRFETAVLVYREFFAERSPETFVLAAGYGPSFQDWSPDAVCASVLATVLDAPLFLTRRDSLDKQTLSEIESGGFKKAFVVGGESAVSSSVVVELAKRGVEVKRIGGIDRFHTSALVAQQLKLILGKNPEICFVVSGENFPDAVSSGFLAGKLQAPILLTKSSSIPFAVRAALNSLNIKKCVISGGEGAVSKAVERYLPSPVRICGLNRYETSMKLVRYAVEELGFSTETVFLATGETFSDALVISSAASLEGNCVLIVPPVPEKQATSVQFLAEFIRPRRIYLVGGLKISAF